MFLYLFITLIIFITFIIFTIFIIFTVFKIFKIFIISTIIIIIIIFIIFIIAVGIAIKIIKCLNGLWFYSIFNYIIKPRVGKSHELLRKEIFENIQSIKSNDQSLRRENAIRILEIGTRKGVNMKYYPKSHFISVDRNTSSQNILKENKKRFPHVTIEKMIAAKREQINDYVPDESVDAVVMTHVLSSVDDQEAVLKAAYKVLVKVIIQTQL